MHAACTASLWHLPVLNARSASSQHQHPGPQHQHQKRSQLILICCKNPIAIPIWGITTYDLAHICYYAHKSMRANSKPVSVIGPRPSSIQRHYWLCSMLEATICRTIRPYDLARKSLCAQAANKARRLHSPKAKQYPARLLCISMLKHAETMVG